MKDLLQHSSDEEFIQFVFHYSWGGDETRNDDNLYKRYYQCVQFVSNFFLGEQMFVAWIESAINLNEGIVRCPDGDCNETMWWQYVWVKLF